MCLHKWKPMWENTVVLKLYLLFIFYLFSIKDIKLNVAQTVKNPPAIRETWVWSLDWEDPLEEGMATHSITLSWRIPWTEEPGGLQSMGSQRVGHDWVTKHSTAHKWKSCTQTSKQTWILTLFKVPIVLRKPGSCYNSVNETRIRTCFCARTCQIPTLMRGVSTAIGAPAARWEATAHLKTMGRTEIRTWATHRSCRTDLVYLRGPHREVTAKGEQRDRTRGTRL